MSMFRNRVLAMIVVVLALIPAAFGEESRGQAKGRDDEYVTEKGFKNKVFEIKHRDPSSIARVLKTLGSGYKGAVVTVDEEFKTVTVRDFPENIAVMEDAIKRLDAPEAARPEIEFHIYVLIASNAPNASNEHPAELANVVKQLQTTLKYKNYALMTSSVHRAKGGQAEVSNKGIAENKMLGLTAPNPNNPNPLFYTYSLRQISIEAGGPIQIGNFVFDMQVPISLNGSEVRYDNIGFKTPVNLRDGDRVVVGMTTMEEKGLVVLLSASVVK